MACGWEVQLRHQPCLLWEATFAAGVLIPTLPLQEQREENWHKAQQDGPPRAHLDHAGLEYGWERGPQLLPSVVHTSGDANLDQQTGSLPPSQNPNWPGSWRTCTGQVQR